MTFIDPDAGVQQADVALIGELALDVSETDSVRAAADRLSQDVAALDALVNNAGISTGAPARASEEW